MKIMLLVTIAIFPLIAYSQTGPAGVGNSTDNMLWLDANRNVYTDAGVSSAANGNSVEQWNDVSGNGRNTTQTTLAAKPLFITNHFNGYPTLRFDGSDDWLVTSIDVPETNFSQFLVLQTISNDADGAAITIVEPNSASSGNHDRQFGINGSKLRHRLWSEQTIGSGADHNDNNPYIALIKVSNPGGQEIFANGSSLATGNKTFSNFNWQTGLVIGGHNSWGFLNCNIPEIIFYNYSLNTAQRILIDNYLSAKYNISLAANDLFTMDDGINGDYDHDVAGIGSVDVTNLHTDAQGTGIIRILNAADLNDNEFLIWGHDNGTQQATETSDVPVGVQARFDRVWRVSEVNMSGTAVDVGSIEIRFDLSGLGTVVASDLRLLVDVNNNGILADETPISGAALVGGNVYQFTGVTQLTDGSQFTLGTINQSQTPLPVQFIHFEAQATKNKSVELSWKTSTELANHFFTVERSKNRLDWEIVIDLNGEDNAPSDLNYKSIDKTPYLGLSYYRLKQTDFNGKYSYSEIKAVNLNKLEVPELLIYPNPTNNKIIAEGNKEELSSIRIQDVLGQNLTMNLGITNSNESTTLIDLTHLNPGIYYITTKSTATKFYKQ